MFSRKIEPEMLGHKLVEIVTRKKFHTKQKK